MKDKIKSLITVQTGLSTVQTGLSVNNTKDTDRLYPDLNKRQKSVFSKRIVLFGLFTCLMTLSAIPAQADGLDKLFGTDKTETSQQDFLRVDQAFTVVPMQKGNKLTVSLEITPQHYLYKDKFSLSLPDGVTATPLKFSKPSHKIDDPNFGKVPIFDQNQVTATATLTNTTSSPINQNVTLTWQGCAKAGLCYPPQKESFSVQLAATSTKTSETKNDSNTNKVAVNKSGSSNETVSKTSSEPVVKVTLDAVPNNDKSKKGVTSSKNESSQDENTSVITSNKSAIDVNDKNTSEPLQVIDNNALNDGKNLDDSEVGSLDNNSVQDKEVVAVDSTTTQPLTGGASNNSANSNTSNSNTSNGKALGGSTLGIDTTVVDQDPFGLAKRPWLALLLLFLAGLGLAFTPCVLPMLPIVSNIVARQHEPTAKGGLILSGSYAIGVATAYGVLGAIIAVFGQSLGIIGWLQNPIIILSFAAIFVVLALYMMDAFIIPIPSKIRQKMQAISQAGDNHLGSSTGSFIAGFLSALVVSPCVSAPLFGALLAVSTIGNPLLGFAALFMLGFGLSAPLMILGVSQGNLMPKAGAWMNWVKQGFALLLFAVALLLISRVLISPLMLVLWALWFVVVAMWAWSWKERGQLLTKPIAIILVIWSTITLIGAATGSQDVWQPLSVFNQGRALSSTTASYNTAPPNTNSQDANSSLSLGTRATLNNASLNNPDIWITSLDELKPILETHERVLVDVTAEWCIECRIMDKTLFTNRPDTLHEWQVVKLDITESNEASSRVLSELNLFGPPALLYFVQGNLKQQQVGTVERTRFEETLAQL